MNQPAALTLRVGVTGHRLNKLAAAEVSRLRREVREVLAALRKGIADIDGNPHGAGTARPTLQVISPLAEGADRIVAETALEQGAALIALLPFARCDYVRDFDSPASRAHFASLLARATEVVELGGPAQTQRDRKAAYAQVGALVVARSDVLIALWDGEEASGAGGTADVVKLAEEGHRPVLWLPTSGGDPGSARLLLGGKVTHTDATEAFVAVARSVLTQQSSSRGIRPSAKN
jgi:hypothetical protein